MFKPILTVRQWWYANRNQALGVITLIFMVMILIVFFPLESSNILKEFVVQQRNNKTRLKKKQIYTFLKNCVLESFQVQDS